MLSGTCLGKGELKNQNQPLKNKIKRRKGWAHGEKLISCPNVVFFKGTKSYVS